VEGSGTGVFSDGYPEAAAGECAAGDVPGPAGRAAAWWRAVYVIWLRDIIKFGRERVRLVTALAQPAIWLLIMGQGLGRSFAGPAGLGYVQYMFPGVMGMTVLFGAVYSGVSVVWDREFGFLKEIVVAPVPRTAVVLGKALAGTTTATLQGLMIGLLAPLVRVDLAPVRLAAATGVMVLLALALAGGGLAVAARMESMQSFMLMNNFLVMPMFFLSGALFPLTGLPDWMRALAAVNPAAYGMDALKAALLGWHEFPLWLDLGVLGGTAALFLGLAAALFR